MRKSNFGIGVYMLKSNIDVYFVTSIRGVYEKMAQFV